MDTKNQEFSEDPFQCIFNEFGFLLDISTKINLYVWFYFIVFLTILYITLETGHMEPSVLLSLSASCYILGKINPEFLQMRPGKGLHPVSTF